MKKFIRNWIQRSVDAMLYFPGPRRWLLIVMNYILNYQKSAMMSYNDSERGKVVEVMNLIHKIKKEKKLMVTPNEAYRIFMLVKKTEKIKGDLAEVGVYKGGSAKVICEAKGGRTLHLFDTFTGIPKVEEIDAFYVSKGEFTSSFEDVKNYLKEYKNVYFYKGFFPATGEPVKNNKFSFVNLDVDIYESTLNGLEFFYPRMNRGGIIMSHDYVFLPSVKKAFDEFFQNKLELIIELPRSQCLVVKV